MMGWGESTLCTAVGEKRRDRGKALYVKDRKSWRAWLEKHHAREQVVWLIYYKRHTGQPSIPYGDSVEEVLCFGWIDSIVRRIDDLRYARMFTPRRSGSVWSALNLSRARRMIQQGRMTAAGLAKVPKAALGFRPIPDHKRNRPAIPGFFKAALSENPRARVFFDRLAPSYKRNYIGWLSSAKQEETKRKRMREAIGLLERGQKLGMK